MGQHSSQPDPVYTILIGFSFFFASIDLVVPRVMSNYEQSTVSRGSFRFSENRRNVVWKGHFSRFAWGPSSWDYALFRSDAKLLREKLCVVFTINKFGWWSEGPKVVISFGVQGNFNGLVAFVLKYYKGAKESHSTGVGFNNIILLLAMIHNPLFIVSMGTDFKKIWIYNNFKNWNHKRSE